MTTPIASLSASAAPTAPTLADVLRRIKGVATVSAQARQNMASAIRVLCRVIDREPRFVVVTAPMLRTVLGSASPGVLGLSRSRWNNVKSDVRRAVHLTRALKDGGSEAVPLSSAWEALVRAEGDVNRRCALRRFGRFCSALQCEPGKVNDEVVDAFYRHLDGTGLSKMPERITRDLIRFWNALGARDGLGLPLLAKRSTDNRYSFAWDQLPEALAADARAFHAARIKPSPFDGMGRPVRRATADKQDRMLRQFASAAIHGGVARDRLQSLADLCRPDVARVALSFLMDRNGGDKGPQASDMAHLIHTVAGVWARSPEADFKVLRGFSRKLHHRQDGMTETNRARLMALVSPKARRALVTLPDRLRDQALALPMSFRSALMMQKAIAIGILLVAPVRLGNLVALDRHVHFVRSLSGPLSGQDSWQLFHEARDVKNGVELHLPLPGWIMDMVDLYMDRYQPLLTEDRTCSLLFPSRGGGVKHDSGFRTLIKTAVLREAGLHVNPHLFRHFSALLFLRAHPGQYESVRQLLGHKSIQTTHTFYACFEQDMAGRMYNAVIEKERTAMPKLTGKAARSSRAGEKAAKHHGHAQPSLAGPDSVPNSTTEAEMGAKRNGSGPAEGSRRPSHPAARDNGRAAPAFPSGSNGAAPFSSRSKGSAGRGQPLAGDASRPEEANWPGLGGSDKSPSDRS